MTRRSLFSAMKEVYQGGIASSEEEKFFGEGRGGGGKVRV